MQGSSKQSSINVFLLVLRQNKPPCITATLCVSILIFNVPECQLWTGDDRNAYNRVSGKPALKADNTADGVLYLLGAPPHVQVGRTFYRPATASHVIWNWVRPTADLDVVEGV
jgi:hypothetical protein